jgi:hypothetical protein
VVAAQLLCAPGAVHGVTGAAPREVRAFGEVVAVPLWRMSVVRCTTPPRRVRPECPQYGSQRAHAAEAHIRTIESVAATRRSTKALQASPSLDDHELPTTYLLRLRIRRPQVRDLPSVPSKCRPLQGTAGCPTRPTAFARCPCSLFRLPAALEADCFLPVAYRRVRAPAFGPLAAGPAQLVR